MSRFSPAPPSFSGLTPAAQRSLGVLFLSGLLFWASLTTFLPTLPLYLDSIGATPQQVGIVSGGFAVGLLIFRSWLGYVADRKRKPVLLLGLASVALAPLGYGLTQSLPLLFGVRMFHGLSVAAFTTGYLTLVTDLAPLAVRGEVIGYMTLVNPVGMALGPALGGWMQASFGYGPLFLTAALLGGVGWLSGSFVQEPENPGLGVAGSPEAEGDRRFWQLLRLPAIYIPAVALLLQGVAFGAFSIFLPLFMAQTQIPLNPGLVFAASAMGSFTIRVITGKASDRWGRGLFITLSLGVYGLGVGTLAWAQVPWQVLLAGALEGSGFGMLVATLTALMADRSRPQERARSLNFCFIGLDLGIAIAGPILGGCIGLWGYPATFALAATLPFVGLLLFITRGNGGLGDSLRFGLGIGVDNYRQ